MYGCLFDKHQKNNIEVQNNSFPTKIKFLTNDSCKYWDAHFFNNEKIVGECMVLYKNYLINEYGYNIKKERVFADYGDIEMGSMQWSINYDTLFVGNYKHKIIKLSKDTLILVDISKRFGRDTLFYYPSKNQKSKLTYNYDKSTDGPVKAYIKKKY